MMVPYVITCLNFFFALSRMLSIKRASFEAKEKQTFVGMIARVMKCNEMIFYVIVEWSGTLGSTKSSLTDNEN